MNMLINCLKAVLTLDDPLGIFFLLYVANKPLNFFLTSLLILSPTLDDSNIFVIWSNVSGYIFYISDIKTSVVTLYLILYTFSSYGDEKTFVVIGDVDDAIGDVDDAIDDATGDEDDAVGDAIDDAIGDEDDAIGDAIDDAIGDAIVCGGRFNDRVRADGIPVVFYTFFYTFFYTVFSSNSFYTFY